MRKGNYTSIEDLLLDLKCHEGLRYDVTLTAGRLHYNYETNRMNLGGHGFSEVMANTHRQLSGMFGIPYKYYLKMLDENRALLGENINGWLQSVNFRDKLVLTRTLNMLPAVYAAEDFRLTGTTSLRAILSARYRKLDNYPLLLAVGSCLASERVQVESAYLGLSSLSIKVLNKESFMIDGEEYKTGVMIRNSEIGLGSLSIEFLLYRQVCKNGLVLPVGLVEARRVHLGPLKENKKAEGKLWDKIALSVWSVLSVDPQHSILSKVLLRSKQTPIADTTIVEVLTNLDLREFEKELVLLEMARLEKKSSLFDLANAVSFISQDSRMSYARATALESFAGDLLVAHVRGVTTGEFRRSTRPLLQEDL